MARTGLLALNLALLALCALVFATTTRRLLFPADSPEIRLPGPASLPQPDRSFDRYRAIASRHLFRAGPPSPAPVAEAEVPIEETTLRVRLIGTVAATEDPRRSTALILDESTRETTLVRAAQTLAGSAARVVRVERERVVLENRGRLEEVRFDESRAGRTAGRIGVPDVRPGAPAPRSSSGSPPSRSQRDRVRALAEKAGAPHAPSSARSVLTQARIIPRYSEDGSMSGLQVHSIRPGSLLETAGFRDGDLVVAVDGAAVSEPGQGLKAFREIGTAERFVVEVEREGGRVTLQHGGEAP